METSTTKQSKHELNDTDMAEHYTEQRGTGVGG